MVQHVVAQVSYGKDCWVNKHPYAKSVQFIQKLVHLGKYITSSASVMQDLHKWGMYTTTALIIAKEMECSIVIYCFLLRKYDCGMTFFVGTGY